MTFAFNALDMRRTNISIVAVRMDLPEGPAKRTDLRDILFSGGLIRRPDHSAYLYVGVNDCEAYQVLITDPFQEYETANL